MGRHLYDRWVKVTTDVSRAPSFLQITPKTAKGLICMALQGKRWLVTGGAGFIGSNFIRLVFDHQRWADLSLGQLNDVTIINLDKLTYAGNLANLSDVAEKHKDRYRFVKGDICDGPLVQRLISECDAVIHFAAESHVDRSIVSGLEFLETNIRGTFTILEAIRQTGRSVPMVHVSTDEVYGTLGATGAFTEETPLQPNSPYSASKASSDLLARAYFHTHKLPVVTTRCSNNYGPFQFPEKLIPLMVTNALADQPLPVYGTGMNVRDWIHVEDHCRGVLSALIKGKAGEVYNFGGRSEVPNIEVVKTILGLVKKPESLIRYVEDRKGHDFRYAIDCSKAEKELGWRPRYKFEEGLRQTVEWIRNHESWWKDIKSGVYREFYKSYYGELQ